MRTVRMLLVAMFLAAGVTLGAGTALASDPSHGFCEQHEDGVVSPANGGLYECHHDPVHGWVWRPY